VKAHRVIESPYLDSREAIAYLRLPSLRALYHHIKENRLPVLRVGEALRFDRRDLDAWVRGHANAIELVRSKRGA
jgi:excisionase family DNA binding protein